MNATTIVTYQLAAQKQLEDIKNKTLETIKQLDVKYSTRKLAAKSFASLAIVVIILTILSFILNDLVKLILYTYCKRHPRRIRTRERNVETIELSKNTDDNKNKQKARRRPLERWKWSKNVSSATTNSSLLKLNISINASAYSVGKKKEKKLGK